jgi:hypothetical protein
MSPEQRLVESAGVTAQSGVSGKRPGTREKALQVNLDPAPYGTFAEIGAGQEVARWLFRAGGAAGTVAKTISAYDMTVSDALYGESDRYVSRRRLEAMLDREYALLLGRLGAKRGASSAFFVFADTVAARSYSRPDKDGDGWMGVRFQDRPGAGPSDLVLHVRLRDRENVREQEALGILGVNLLFGVFYVRAEPAAMIQSLQDGLSAERVEVDLIRFSGPAFQRVDNRLMSLELVELGLTPAAMFTAGGEVVQPAEILHGRSILVERGSFRPVVRPQIDMLDEARKRFRDEGGGDGDPVSVMEMTLRNVKPTEPIGHSDFLALADILGALGRAAMISKYGRHYELAEGLRQYTKGPIAFVLGCPALRDLFDARYYAGLGGGVFDALGRLFGQDVVVYVYPYRDSASGEIVTARSVTVPPPLRHLHAHLVENGLVRELDPVREDELHIRPDHVLTKILAGAPEWEAMVPEGAASLIRQCRCLGGTPPGGGPGEASSKRARQTEGEAR